MRVQLASLAVLVLAACAGAPPGPGAATAPVVAVTPPPAPASAPTWPALDFAELDRLALTLGYQLGLPAGVTIAPDGATALYRRSEARSFVADLYELDLATGAERRVLTAAELLAGAAETLTAEEKARRERMRLATRGITSFDLSRDGRWLVVPLGAQVFLHDRQARTTRALPLAGTPYDPRLSRDGRRLAYVVDGDLHVLEVASGKDHKLTKRRGPDEEWGVAEFVAQEEMARLRGFWWSPDGERLAVQRTDHAGLETFHVADPMHPERAPTPFRYPRAGKANATVELAILSARGGKPTIVRWDRAAFPYLAAVTWPERGPLTIVVQDRAQRVEQVLAVGDDGATRRLLEERDDAWLNLAPGFPRWLPDGSGFLWASERGGDWALELRDPTGATVVRTYDVPGFDKLAAVDRQGNAWVLASVDPRMTHVLKVPLDGRAPERVAHGIGRYDVVVSEESGAYAIGGEGLDGRRTVRASGPRGERELPSVAEAPPIPQVELVEVEVEDRRHFAAIVRPRAFEAGRRYPVLVSVYGGPHVTYVGTTGRSYLMDQWLADAGFVVVRMDGRGTPGRGRAWERAIAGDLATVPLADQVAILDQLAARFPELDRARVGISGWSFGGTMAALAVLRRPDVFRAAVSGAPVTDWKNYDTHYTERYMGLVEANPAGYAATSLVAEAGRLGAPLLLIHGTTDDNVHLRHTLELGDALFRAGKPFELLPLNGFTHMVPDPAIKRALYGRIVAFLRSSLE